MVDSLASTGRLGRYDVVHFATHAFVDDAFPERSALVLSQVGLPNPVDAALRGAIPRTGLIRVWRILTTWRLHNALVVLSACETGVGRDVSGEGYMGFVWAFLRAGARNVVASLWKVDDTATRVLMERFYDNFIGRGMSPTSALCEARRWLRDYRTPDGRRPFAAPFYWGAFVITGDAR